MRAQIEGGPRDTPLTTTVFLPYDDWILIYDRVATYERGASGRLIFNDLVIVCEPEEWARRRYERVLDFLCRIPLTDTTKAHLRHVLTPKSAP